MMCIWANDAITELSLLTIINQTNKLVDGCTDYCSGRLILGERCLGTHEQQGVWRWQRLNETNMQTTKYRFNVIGQSAICMLPLTHTKYNDTLRMNECRQITTVQNIGKYISQLFQFRFYSTANLRQIRKRNEIGWMTGYLALDFSDVSVNSPRGQKVL